MTRIQACAVPERALLRRYCRDRDYTDCYQTMFDGEASCAQFVAAFYTSWVFKLERVILAVVASRSSTDAEAQQLAEATSSDFAAWRVEDRGDDQLLVSDFKGRTRSWLMTMPVADEHTPRTWLYFGSAVVGVGSAGSRAGLMLGSLLVFHRLYSRVLLGAAHARLRRQRPDRSR